MSIKKINKIKNLGLVFSDYRWKTSLPPFEPFNLFYGWNGCGKTTLTRLFDAIGGVSVDGLEYEIESDQGIRYKQKETFPKKIRVFNQDYIWNNLTFLESRTNAISIVLGHVNKGLVEKIKSDNELLYGIPADPANPGIVARKTELLKDKSHKTRERDGKFTEIAKTIGAAIGGNALRDYRKPQAESDFISMTIKAELSELELERYSNSAKQESLPAINQLSLPKVAVRGEYEALETSSLLKSIDEQAAALLLKTVESEILTRLASNEDISAWVEQGFHLHEKYPSGVCEYCLQEISGARLEQLARHFNDADRELKHDLDVLVEILKSIESTIRSLRVPDRSLFYTNFRGSIQSLEANFEIAKQKIVMTIETHVEQVKLKKSKTTEAVILKERSDLDDLSTNIEEVNQVVREHNETTIEFSGVKETAIKQLKFHYLSTIFDEVQKLDAEILELDGNIKSLEAENREIQIRIVENMGLISSKQKACDEINEKLTTFLGHQELTVVPHTKIESGGNGEVEEDVTGYDIVRGDKLALYLSEGEKTAIAFVYFVVHLGDQEFDIRDGIVVIDDPISSLDSNSLFQAFSFLKNSVKDAEQVFILTHNFDFLKLLINWRKNTRGRKKTNYYMIRNSFLDDVRNAYIDKMDNELCEYESEYHYLFKLLKQLRDDLDGSILKAYPVPNIARKVWDTFLMFTVPNGKSSYSKMEYLKSEGFDEQKLDAIYKFTNDQSHITGSGFDPSLVPETKNVVNELFEMMKTISPDHLRIIDEATL